MLPSALALLLALAAALGAGPCRAADAGVVATSLWRTRAGEWLLLAYDRRGVWLYSPPDVAHPDDLTERVPLVGAPDAAPLPAEGPIEGAACCLDGSDRLHLAWIAGGTTWYARGAVDRLADRAAWHGPSGGTAPERVARGVAPRDCAIAPGARPMIAGERDGGVAVLRCDGEWRESFSCADGSRPSLLRDGRRALHLAFASPDGIRYHRSADGAQWLPREVPLFGGAGQSPALALLGERPVVAGAAGGRPAIATRREEGWVAALPWVAAGAEDPPRLAMDRHGGVWCVWASGGWVHAARWLGGSLGPDFTLGMGERVLLVEQSPPAAAPDLGVLADVGGALRVLRIATPALAVMDDRPLRFLDLLDVVEMDGAVREAASGRQGVLPPPMRGHLLPGGIAACGKRGADLRAWFTLREGDKRTCYTAVWSRGGWGKAEPLRLASPRPWLHAPEGGISVLVDGDEPDAARRYKMIAESAGAATSLLTSPDGVAWSYYAGLPQLRPLSFVRDLTARAEDRWKVYGVASDPPEARLLTSPDREHWYPGPPAAIGRDVTDACFWNEDGALLGILNGGRTLVRGVPGGRLAAIADLAATGIKGRVFAPPLGWGRQRVLFAAEPEAWRWVEAPEGRWVALRSAAEERPGTCVTVPVTLARRERHLRLDVRTGPSGRSRGGVCVEVLDAAGRPVPGYSARITRADGWREASFGGGRALWKLQMESIRLRFTVEPGARLYGARFVE